MTTLTFWARADSITANNATLNPIGINGANGVPAFQMTFTDNNNTGDLNLEVPPGGGVDPDTQVIINGTTYNFTLQVTGVLPNNSQVPALLVGETVALIVVNIGGVNHEYFFVLGGENNLGQPITQGLMNQIGTGAIPLTSEDTTPGPVYPCFCSGTLIATPSGQRTVETLVAGDTVLTASGETKQIMWIGATCVSGDAQRINSRLCPVVIPAHAFGGGLPTADLHVSPQHRVLIESPESELFFGEPAVLVAAKFLVGTFAEMAEPEADLQYFHILLADHDMLLSNGLPTESFQPARRTMDVMGSEARQMLEAVIATLGEEALLSRKDSFLSLRQSEAEVLLNSLEQVRVGRRPASNLSPATLN